ncbi:MAG: hypothetical protein E6R11_07290, partial [Rhodocyclaceae bacterium]
MDRRTPASMPREAHVCLSYATQGSKPNIHAASQDMADRSRLNALPIPDPEPRHITDANNSHCHCREIRLYCEPFSSIHIERSRMKGTLATLAVLSTVLWIALSAGTGDQRDPQHGA